MSLLQRVVFLHSEELVSVITCHYHDVVIGGIERDLKWFHVLSLADTLERKALLLVPVPQNDLVAVLTGL